MATGHSPEAAAKAARIAGEREKNKKDAYVPVAGWDMYEERLLKFLKSPCVETELYQRTPQLELLVAIEERLEKQVREREKEEQERLKEQEEMEEAWTR